MKPLSREARWLIEAARHDRVVSRAAKARILERLAVMIGDRLRAPEPSEGAAWERRRLPPLLH